MWGLRQVSQSTTPAPDSFRARVGHILVDLRKTPVRKRILSG